MSEHPELDAELARLNAAVEAAVAARKKWMDEHMADYAKFKVGDEIYDRETGRLLGIVTELYRFWGDRDPRYDTSMSIEYKYEEPPGMFCSSRARFINNTSSSGRYTNWAFASRAEVIADRAAELERLSRGG